MTYPQNSSTVVLSGAEQTILTALGGRPWRAEQFTEAALADARRDWRHLRTAAGFAGPGRWLTTSRTNPKMAKSGFDTVGVTLHSAGEARKVWRSLDADVQKRIADALGSTVDDVAISVRATVCPYATPACIDACVTGKSAHSALGRTDVSRLTRTLFHLHRPAPAFCLTGDGLKRLHGDHGADCRWRVNVSDDIRWEHLAPGLFEFGVRGYSYTKWPAVKRPGFTGFNVVYSATERTTTETIVDLVAGGERVAVIFDVKASAMPTVWNGIRVSDGNRTDDLYEHVGPCIVGLAAKGPTKAIKQRMRESGFSRAV